MGSKLEKAQLEYEKLLRDLGEKAAMVEMFERADAAVLQEHRKAKETLADRKTELEFIGSEIARQEAELKSRRESLEKRINETQASIDKTEKVIGVKKGKTGPLKTRLSGAEFDLRFAEKAMTEEQRKQKQAEEKEDFSRAKQHEEIIKRMKIDLMKRNKEIFNLKREISAIENPAKQLGGSVSEAEAKLAALQEELDQFDSDDDIQILEDLKQQRANKERELRLGEAHVLDSLADVGENLYEKRISHPVLNKYYVDIDKIAEVIDQLQEK